MGLDTAAAESPVAPRRSVRNAQRKVNSVTTTSASSLQTTTPQSTPIIASDQCLPQPAPVLQAVTSIPHTIRQIHLGSIAMATDFGSPYPDEYGSLPVLYLCEFCLKYMRLQRSVQRHRLQCGKQRPPGTTVYAKGPLRIYRIDGSIDKLYCQNLCLVSKLFVDQKAVCYDTEAYMFHVLTRTHVDDGVETDRILGFFSREKDVDSHSSLACILVLPPYRQSGYGRMLVEFSYEICRLERRVASPDRPLSSAGHRVHWRYWQSAILATLRDLCLQRVSASRPQARGGKDAGVSVAALSQMMCLSVSDIVEAVGEWVEVVDGDQVVW
ncbi:acyl-CoA N-acyltransferase [Entophlyctis helioformis]|nr:acyl-CoA N-acyltransferase [Entophlyctis helioformis]KAI8916811.1 acyl-CoA N-acyltransferase [Entophlyctis helioformis]